MPHFFNDNYIRTILYSANFIKWKANMFIKNNYCNIYHTNNVLVSFLVPQMSKWFLIFFFMSRLNETSLALENTFQDL